MIILGYYSSGASGAYSLSGGLATVAGLYIGYLGAGTINQTGGVMQIALGGSLNIGAVSAGGAYSLSGTGLLDCGGAEEIGDSGSAVFNQSGGVNTIANGGDLFLASDGGISSTYSLSGGTLTAPLEYIGLSGEGYMIQTGGTNTVGGGGLYLGYNSGSSGFYSLSGAGSLTVNGSLDVGSATGGTATLAVSGGQLTVNSTLRVYDTSGTNVTISGGTVTAGNTNNLAVITASGGSASLGAVTGTGALNLGDPSGSVTASELQQSSVSITSGGKLTLTGGGSSNEIDSLTISGNGVLDLTNTALLINYGSNPDPVAAIRGYLISGYNGGNWNGPGIDTTSPTGNKYAIGYADSADPENPAGLPSGTIEIKYTLYGDANLDGVVNSVDFGILAANFGQSGKVWDEGDFTYSGVVNSVDFGLLAANFGQSTSGAAVNLSSADWAALDAFAEANGLMSELPEPASGALVLLAAMGTMARRRRTCRAEA